MRDEIDARIFTAHHDQFARLIDDVIGAFTPVQTPTGLGAFGRQVLIATAAVAMSLLTLGGSVA